MQRRQVHQRGAARARVAERNQAPWLLAMAAAAAILVLGVTLARAQTAVPEVVQPKTDSPTLPPSRADGPSTPQPRSENPLANSGAARPIPDSGVITPPPTNTTPVIRPPATGTMPVIPPPGSAGGDRSVVPK